VQHKDVAAVERTVLQTWAEILPQAPGGPDDDFFDLGGQSLHLVTFMQAVRRDYGIDLPVADLFAAEFSARRCAEAMCRELAAAGPDGGR
jgi:acyl carrier protein